MPVDLSSRYRAPFARLLCAAILLGVAAAGAHAQDSHYWTHQYGSQGVLLGGAVIGSADDLSSTYYNPGALALNPDPEIVQAVRVFDWTTITLKDGLGEGNSIRAPQIRPAPSLFAVLLKFPFLGDHRVAASIFTRHSFSTRIQGTRLDSLPPPPADDLVADALIDQSLGESWLGLTWSHALGRRFGVGVTQYLAIRGQRANEDLSIQLLDPGDGLRVSALASDFNYNNWRLLWKVGLAARFDPVTLGVTITTPGARLFGSGQSGVNITRTGVDQDGDGATDPILVSDLQKDLKSVYKSPLSVGVGGAYHFGPTSLHLAAEWFDAIDEYTVLDAGRFVGQSPPDTFQNMVRLAARSVVNAAAGLRHDFSRTVSAYVSFTTDASAFARTEPRNAASTSWNIYSVAGGTTFSVGRAGFTVGLGYSWGNEDDPIFSLTPPGGGEPIQFGKSEFRRLKLMFGFEFGSSSARDIDLPPAD